MGGRKKGALNKKTEQSLQSLFNVCAERGINLYEFGVDALLNGRIPKERKKLSAETRISIWRELMGYAYPKLAAIKHITDNEDTHITFEWEQGSMFDEIGEPREIPGEIIENNDTLHAETVTTQTTPGE